MWNVEHARAQHNKWLPMHHSTIVHVMQGVGHDAVHEAQATNAVKNRTGALRGGWLYRMRSLPDLITTSVRNYVLHAFFQEHGTGIYGPTRQRIYPRRAMFLRWRNTDTGKICFARSVRGVKPKWIGKHAAFEAWAYGKSKLFAAATRIVARF